jgi:hypothetical protein
MPICGGNAHAKCFPTDHFWREADIPTNGIKAVAAEPSGADEFADRGVARELADELGFDRRPPESRPGGPW